MKIKNITLKNFYRFGNNEQTFDLTGSGITAICGNNGAGKSTLIIDSLLFGFYASYRTPKIDDVVNRYIGKNCKVGIEFEEDGNDYKIIRYRKHDTHNNNVYIFKNDTDISGHTATETNQIIQDIIKIPYTAFTNSTVFSTELYSAFLGNTAADRLNVFENILSLKEINLFYVKCKEFIKKIKEEINDVNMKLFSKDAEITTLNNNIVSYSNNAKSKLLEMKSKKEELKTKKTAASKLIEEYGLIDVNEERQKLLNNKLIEEYNIQINNKEEEKRKLKLVKPEKELEIISRYKDVDFYSNKMKEEKYKEDLETMKTRENDYNLSMQKISSLSEKQSNLNNSLVLNKNKILEVSKTVESLTKSICPFCGQKMHDVDSKIEEANKQIRELEEENKDLTKELEETEFYLKEERENYNYLIGDYNRIKESLNKNFISNSDLIEEQYKNALKVGEEYAKAVQENLIKEDLIDNEILRIKEKVKKIESSKYTKEELDNISSLIESQKEIIANCDAEILAIDSSVKSIYDVDYINKIKLEVSEKQKDLDDVKNELKIKQKELLHYEYLQECFSNKSGGFKKYFIFNMIDTFNEKVNQYLPFFFNEDVKIIFDKDLNETITVDDVDASFKSFSQGQRQKAELAVSFALFDIARIFFSNDSKLLVLDEVDKGLDKWGIRSMLNLLNGFDKQLRILIVSHNPLLTDEIEEKVIVSQDENGFSLIV